MDIEMMREFVRLAETLNFTKTAKEFYISQSTLSRHLSAMESELGSTLLLRSTHEVELTEAGKVAYRHLKGIAESYDEMGREVTDVTVGTTGSFTLGFLYYGGMSYMRDGLERFSVACPNVRIRFLSQQPYQVFESLLSGEEDIGFVFRSPGMDEREWEFVPVHDCKPYAFCRDDDPLAAKPAADYSDLEGRKIVLTEVDEWYNRNIMLTLETQGINAFPIKACSQIDLFRSAVAETRGILLADESFPCEPRSGITAVALPYERGRYLEGFYSRRADRKPCVENFLLQWR
jgi:DNA-binding transcriptional LysR family regulator